MAKAAYVGVVTEMPVAIAITSDNASNYFSIEHYDGYGFEWVGDSFEAENYEEGCLTTCTALVDMPSVSFDYSVTGDAETMFNIDKDEERIVKVSSAPASGSWSGSLSVGETLVLDFYPYESDQRVVISNFAVASQTDTQTKSIARKIKKAYVGVGRSVMRDLPSGYAQLEYIEGTGSQYVDTGVTPNNDTRVVMDFELTVDKDPETIFGARQGTSSNAYQFIRTTVFRSDYNTAYSQSWSATALKRYTVDKDGETTTFNGTSQSYANAAFTAPGPLYLFALNNNGTAQWFATGKVYSCQVYEDGERLTRDYVPAEDASGVAGLFDMVTQAFFPSASATAFAAGTYATPGGIARKIKKAYVGVGGKARPFWSGGKLSYYGTATALSAGRGYLAAASVGKYALFGGGQTPSYSNVVNAYDESLTRSVPTALSASRHSLAATSVGKYALFGGGVNASRITTVDAYNESLTRSVPTSLSAGRGHLAATSIGKYALFGGGITSSGAGNVVDAYNESLTRSVPTALSYATRALAATSVGKYALFGGGYNGSTYQGEVNAYDESLTRSVPTEMERGGQGKAAASVGKYALFGGGQGSSTASAVFVYDESLTYSKADNLNKARHFLAGASVDGFALFGGGLGDDTYSNVVDAYDESLTHSVTTALSKARDYLAATSVGNCALFGGGRISSGYTDAVDAYVVV